MSGDETFFPVVGAAPGKELFVAGSLSDAIEVGRARETGGKDAGFIALLETRSFLRECIRRSLQSAMSARVNAYSSLQDMDSRRAEATPELIVLSLAEAAEGVGAETLRLLAERFPLAPVVVLSSNSDPEFARTVIRSGAKGYVPCTMGFEIAVEAVRFVLAGGSYAPTDCLVAPSAKPATGREMAVLRCIQQGKSNKVIAYELNMCESTVKVHVRNLMKKLKAKNRTEVAIKTRHANDAPLSPRALSAPREQTLAK